MKVLPAKEVVLFICDRSKCHTTLTKRWYL